MSGQGVGGETPKEKGLNSKDKACCSGWEGPPLPHVRFDDSSRNRAGLPDTHLSAERAQSG